MIGGEDAGARERAPLADPVGTPAGSGRLDSLTGLRALAALLVLAYHLDVDRGDTSHYAFAENGYVGVSLFYVLSGFVLTWSWKSAVRRPDFYLLRLARIYPIYLAVLVGTVAVDWAQGTAPGVGPTLAAVGLVQSWIPIEAYYFGVRPVFWSLSVELFFYALFPFLIVPLARATVLARRLVAAGASLTLFVIAFVGLSYSPMYAWMVYVFPLARLPEFLIGIIAGLEARERSFRRVSPLAAAAAVLAGYVALGHVPTSFRPASILVLPFAALLISAAQADLEGRRSLYRHRWLVTLGLWSYALYLLHTPLIGAFGRVFAEGSVITDVALVVASCVAATLAYALVERPVEGVLRRRILARQDAAVESP